MEERDFTGELHFSGSRSSGPGGQHVNVAQPNPGAPENPQAKQTIQSIEGGSA